jgi:hypothetical protein
MVIAVILGYSLLVDSTPFSAVRCFSAEGCLQMNTGGGFFFNRIYREIFPEEILQKRLPIQCQAVNSCK